jgi:pilus assembly protein Flp/PilA
MRVALRKFIEDESGATAIEYSLISVMIAAVIIAGFATFGPALQGQFDKISSAIQGE